MNFADFNSHTNPLFIDNKLLKFEDIIESSQLQLIFDFKNRNLPDDVYSLFDYSDNVHNHNTRMASNKGIFIPSISTFNYGNKSLRFSSSSIWNNFVKSNSDILSCKSKAQFKLFLKKTLSFFVQ